MPLPFRHPFTCIVAGAASFGKSTWIFRLLKHASVMIEPPPALIIYCYGEYQPAFEELKTLPIPVQLVEGLPEKELLKGSDESTTNRPPKLVILDDLMGQMATKGARRPAGASAGDCDLLTQLFTRGSHHWNLSVIFVSQSIFFGNQRTARINCHYLVLMRSPSDKLQIMTVGKCA